MTISPWNTAESMLFLTRWRGIHAVSVALLVPYSRFLGTANAVTCA